MANAIWNEERGLYQTNRNLGFASGGMRMVAWVIQNCRTSHALSMEDTMARCGVQGYNNVDPKQRVVGKSRDNADALTWWEALDVADKIVRLRDTDNPVRGMEHFINMDGRQLTKFPNLLNYSPDMLKNWLNKWRDGDPAQRVDAHPDSAFEQYRETDLFALNEMAWGALRRAP